MSGQKKILSLISLCVAYFFLVPWNLFAQDPGAAQSSYARKSISYIPAVYIQGSQAHELKNRAFQFLEYSVREHIEMPRFDFNQLPDPIIKGFLEEVYDHRQLSTDEIEGLLNETVVPGIIELLQTEAEIRARDLVTEEQKQQFIAVKAKDYGVTAEQLEQVMNSAYLYFPYVNRVQISQNGTMSNCSISGGIVWYKVEALNETPTVEVMHRETASAFGTGKRKENYLFQGRLLNGVNFALYTAIDNFAMNLKAITQSLPVFKLFGLVQYVSGSRLEFDLGREEGVRVDDGFYIGEQVLQPDSSVSTQRVGFIRTTSVGGYGKNRYQFSRAMAITGRQFAKGMSVIEHPRMPLDFVFKLRSSPVSIESGELVANWISGEELFRTIFPNSYSGNAVGLDLEARYHLGRHMDIPMLLFTIGGSYNYIPMDIQVKSFQRRDWVTTSPKLWQARVGMEKKYFFRRIGFTLGGNLGMAMLNATETIWGFDLDEHEIGLSNVAVGATIQSGLEYVIQPDFHFGVYAGYQLYPGSSSWSFKVDDDSYDLLTFSRDDLPGFKNMGPIFGIYFHYQPPALSFNPLDFLRALSGL